MAGIIVQFHQHFQLINFLRRHKCIWFYFWHTVVVAGDSEPEQSGNYDDVGRGEVEESSHGLTQAAKAVLR